MTAEIISRRVAVTLLNLVMIALTMGMLLRPALADDDHGSVSVGTGTGENDGGEIEIKIDYSDGNTKTFKIPVQQGEDPKVTAGKIQARMIASGFANVNVTKNTTNGVTWYDVNFDAPLKIKDITTKKNEVDGKSPNTLLGSLVGYLTADAFRLTPRTPVDGGLAGFEAVWADSGTLLADIHVDVSNGTSPNVILDQLLSELKAAGFDSSVQGDVLSYQTTAAQTLLIGGFPDSTGLTNIAYDETLTATAVPEPSSILLFGLEMAGLSVFVGRQRPAQRLRQTLSK